ncbi:MAG TPA: ferritin-like domain-containing protein [Xanthobacteraceae bacterium]|jgi:ferritin-like metal-binding protein YciE|nr:ferritin-like domain-containing protein [Xanthobacteraceae bacterium]
MTTGEDMLMNWLRDAHAMEQQAEQMLSSQAQRIENYPELKAKVEQHLQETRRQADLIRGCIERRGSSTSTMKDTAGRFTALAQGLSGLFVGDEVVKGSMASYTFEEMEIASYKVLIAASEECGDSETKRVCEGILREEEAMASWLDEHLPGITRQYLARAETGVTAKH